MNSTKLRQLCKDKIGRDALADYVSRKNATEAVFSVSLLKDLIDYEALEANHPRKIILCYAICAKYFDEHKSYRYVSYIQKDQMTKIKAYLADDDPKRGLNLDDVTREVEVYLCNNAKYFFNSTIGAQYTKAQHVLSSMEMFIGTQ